MVGALIDKTQARLAPGSTPTFFAVVMILSAYFVQVGVVLLVGFHQNSTIKAFF
jgi:hypothetical protein